MNSEHQKVNVCLLLEGTYPYITGNVADWVHEHIREQSHLTFQITAILPPDTALEYRYQLPENVLKINNVFLHRLQKGNRRMSSRSKKRLFRKLETPLFNLQTKAKTEDLQKVITLLAEAGDHLGSDILLNSREAWGMLVRIYNTTMANSSFLDYFRSWRALMVGLYATLLTDIPEADCYHALCTGFAGLLLSRIKLETGKPCLLTELGIYTNERRIEISKADWLEDPPSQKPSVERDRFKKNLKDLWLEAFTGYSSLCYDACDKIITLSESNRELQLEDGAEPDKLSVIPNGINVEHYAAIKRKHNGPPTIAMTGGVVPIKDVKTFIHAAGILQQSVENLRAWVIGPTDDDEEYFRECTEMVEHSRLQEIVTFTGRGSIDEYLDQIDVIVLTNLNETSPQVLLEAGATGIPSVAPEVGACREIIEGRSDEDPVLGQGGLICSLSSPGEIAKALSQLINHRQTYVSCSSAIKKRVRTYYNEKDQHQAYQNVYRELIG